MTPQAFVAEADPRLAALVFNIVNGSPFDAPSRWPSAVVVVSQEEKRVTSRGDFASWLAANDLKREAHECVARRVPRGHVLIWLQVDVPEIALAGFCLLDLETALRNAAARNAAKEN